MTTTIAAVWLVLITAVTGWWLVRKTNRYFWYGAGFALCLTVAAVLTGFAITTVVEDIRQ